MMTTKNITQEQAYQIGEALMVNWNVTDINQFRRGLEVELEHGSIDARTDVTHNDMILTGKIALAHLNELSDYYTRLETIENVNIKVANNTTEEKNLKTSLLAGLVVGGAFMLLTNYLKKKKS